MKKYFKIKEHHFGEQVNSCLVELENNFDIFYLRRDGNSVIVINGISFWFKIKYAKTSQPMIGLSRNNAYFKWFYVKQKDELLEYLKDLDNEILF